MKHLMVFASLALFLCSCATVSSKPEELQRTWDAAHVQVLHGDTYIFGRLSAPINQQKLAKLPSELRFPTVIYLHGCAGLDWGNISNTTGALIKQGFALIAPDSFALRNRTMAPGHYSFCEPTIRTFDIWAFAPIFSLHDTLPPCGNILTTLG